MAIFDQSSWQSFLISGDEISTGEIFQIKYPGVPVVIFDQKLNYSYLHVIGQNIHHVTDKINNTVGYLDIVSFVPTSDSFKSRVPLH